MSNYVRAMNEDFGENTEVRSIDIDLSLNRSLEELVSSYFEAYEAGFGCDSFLDVNVNSTAADVSDYYVLENYLSDMGAL
jgi:hypothetical protein